MTASASPFPPSPDSALLLQPLCLTCAVWDPGRTNTSLGRCRLGAAGATETYGWPATEATDWCGAYQPPSLMTVFTWAQTQPKRWIQPCRCVGPDGPAPGCSVCQGRGQAPTVLVSWVANLAEAVAPWLPPDPATPEGGDA